MFIREIPGEVLLPDGTITDIAALFGLTPVEVTAGNDGRSNPPVAVMTIGGKDYSLGDVLKAVGAQLTGETVAEITKPNAYYKVTPAFSELKKEKKLNIVWGGRHADSVAFTKDEGEVTAITAVFTAIDTAEATLTVSTFTIESTGTTKTDATYELTAAT